jgi:putative ABC transport system permease protein
MTDSRRHPTYAWMLRALPEDMRRRYGRDMEDLFARRIEERSSPFGRSGVWLRAIVDVAAQSVALRFDERAGRVGRSGLSQDVRYGVRGVRKSPGLAILAVVMLALGIGASTATFSIVNGVLLEGLPFEDPDRIVLVWPEVNANKAMTVLAEDRMTSLGAVSGFSAWSVTLTGAGQPRELRGLQVSANYFDIVGFQPRIGRTFTRDEEFPGAAGVVVLSHDLWVTAFGADASIVGRTIELGGADYERRTVIGVMPSGADELILDTDVWIPLEGDPATSLQEDDSWYVNYRLARLAPGATLEQANAEVGGYARFVQGELPGQISVEEAALATVRGLGEYLTRDVRASIWIALGTVGIVLLIGCFNVANLLLARGDRRVHDHAVRAALGASRLRLTRMMLAEAGVLGALGGALGILAAYGLVRVIVNQAPTDLPGIRGVYVSPGVLAFAVGATVIATLVAGLMPALRAGRIDATAGMTKARGGSGRRASRLTPVLVAIQISLAVIVTIGSGLMLRSLTTLLAVDPGVDGEQVMAFRPVPPAGRYADGNVYRDYYLQVSERVAALPFVESVGGIHLLPGKVNNWSFPTFPEGYNLDENTPNPSVNFRAVRGDYFGVARLPLRQGRPITDADREDADRVVVVNETFVARFWPGENAIGKTLSFFSPTGDRYRVVGVAADVHQHGPEREPLAEMYFSHGQVPWNEMSMWVLARVHPVDGGPETYAAAMRDAVWSIDPDVPITEMQHLADVLVETTRGTRFLTLLLGAFGALALVLSAVGVFGVTAYSSGRRTAEFGVRLALGSSRTSILRSAMLRSLVPVCGGLAVGLLGAFAAAQLLESAVFGVTTSDPLTFLGVTAVMALTALLAAAIPAWLATRVDPVRVLSSD